jgi:hypothetical protein
LGLLSEIYFSLDGGFFSALVDNNLDILPVTLCVIKNLSATNQDIKKEKEILFFSEYDIHLTGIVTGCMEV